MLTIRDSNGNMVGKIDGTAKHNFLASDCYELMGSKFLVMENIVITMKTDTAKMQLFLWKDYTLKKEY